MIRLSLAILLLTGCASTGYNAGRCDYTTLLIEDVNGLPVRTVDIRSCLDKE